MLYSPAAPRPSYARRKPRGGPWRCLAVAAVVALFLYVTQRSSNVKTCRRLAATRVFSHCGAGLGIDSPVVTEGRVEYLYSKGIAEFDMDLFWSTDGTMYVGHPRLLKEEFGVDPFELDDKRVRAGALTVERLLDMAADDLPDLVLALDLKGSGVYPAYNAYLSRLRDMVEQRRLQHRAWIWVDDARTVANLGPSQGVRFGRPLKDGGDPAADCAAQLEPADARRFEFLGPSLTCANHRFFASGAVAPWRSAPRHYLVWVVDDGASLRELLKTSGADEVSVVSNKPHELHKELKALRKESGCARDASIRFGELAALEGEKTVLQHAGPLS